MLARTEDSVGSPDPEEQAQLVAARIVCRSSDVHFVHRSAVVQGVSRASLDTRCEERLTMTELTNPRPPYPVEKPNE
jgi:hypothetical protein